MNKKRPLILVFITIGTFVSGIALLPVACTLSAVSSRLPSADLLGAITGIAGILLMTLGYGLWTYNETARKGTIVTNYIGVALTALPFIPSVTRFAPFIPPASAMAAIATTALALAMNLYLHDDQTRDLFTEDPSNEEWRYHHDR